MMMNLRWKPIVSSSFFCPLNLQSAMCPFFLFAVRSSTRVRLKRCRRPGFKDLDPESASNTKSYALTAFLALKWKHISARVEVGECCVCLLVLFARECLWVVFVLVWCCAVWKPIPARKRKVSVIYIIRYHKFSSRGFKICTACDTSCA